MIPKRAIKELSRILGPDRLTTRRDALNQYGTDATKLAYSPDAVAFPGRIQEIADILSLANQERFPVIPRGAGSGKSGGALPVLGGLVLAMDRFDRKTSSAKFKHGVIIFFPNKLGAKF